MTQPLVIAQISDCHLFAEPQQLHCKVNVYQNLVMILHQLSKNSIIDLIVFTGDLSQDHSDKSYQLFSDAVRQAKITAPVYYLAGNHDLTAQLNQYLNGVPFCQDKQFERENWQILLLDSKSATPAGRVSQASFDKLAQLIDKEKSQLIFMHHHPLDVGYFIDRHGLENKTQFWQEINAIPSIKGIACGHVHRGMTMTTERASVYTCPATSIQFDPAVDGVSALDVGPGYRLLQLTQQGEISTELYYL
jgi:Icc protein